MYENLNELKEAIKKRLSEIKFDEHFYFRQRMRPYLTEEFIGSKLGDFDDYLGFQFHNVKGEVRYRIGIKLSRKYSLVVVLLIGEEGLYIKTAWKTSGKWQKSVQK